jgi:predicted nucleic acid-binding protein
LSFDLGKALRRLKPARRTGRLTRRPDAALPFVPPRPTGGPELLLDTCVYIDVLQGRAPVAVRSLLTVRLCNHSGVALAELTHLFGRLDPRDARTAVVLRQIAGTIADMPQHRLSAPSARNLGEAGILAGLVARLANVGPHFGPALLNDAALYLQAAEQGQTLLTRNIREFDWFDQLLPGGRVFFYRQA